MIAIIALQLASASVNSVQIIIISPTRELATQTHDNIVKMGEFTSVKSHVCIGGKKVGEDVRKLSHGSVHVVSGTPGRMYDMIQRQVLDMKKIRVVFIDEADEMLSMGFKDQVYDIYRYAPSTVQVVLVSATLPADVIEMTEKFMVKPISVLVKNDGLTLKGLTQFHIDVEKDGWKFETLTDLYERLTITQAVVFCNTRSRVEWLAKKMVEQDFHVACMHGDMRQKDRDDVMDKFRKGEQRVLIATDVWGRGIDVQQVSLVINYDIPQKIEDYLHRVGRSARFGRKGLAITFVTSTEMGKITSIERHYNSRIREAPEDMDKYM